MTENPYQPPGVSEGEPSSQGMADDRGEGSPEAGLTKKRPLGVTVLCAIYAGVIFLTVYHLYIDLSGTFWTVTGGPVAFNSQHLITCLHIAFILVGILGLWLGRAWGWYVMAFYLASRVLEQTYGVATLLPNCSFPFDSVSKYIALHALRNAVRAFIQAAVLGYLFTSVVLTYCDVSARHRRHLALLLLGISIAWVLLKRWIVF